MARAGLGGMTSGSTDWLWSLYILLSPPEAVCLSWVEANQMHWIRVSWPRRQGVICLLCLSFSLERGRA